MATLVLIRYKKESTTAGIPTFILLAQARQLVSGKNLTLRSNIWCLFSTNHYTLYVCKQFCKLKAACVIFQTAFECLHTIRAHLFHSREFIRISDKKNWHWKSSLFKFLTTRAVTRGGAGLFSSPPVFGQTDEVVDCTLMISPTTLTFRAVGRFENPGVPVVIRWA